MIKAFVTKYALTTGVLKISGTEQASTIGTATRKCLKDPRFLSDGGFGILFEGDYALTEEEAQAQVQKKLEAQIKATEKKLQKLLALNSTKIVKNAKVIS